MKETNQGREAAMKLHYSAMQDDLGGSILRGERLLAENQFNTTKDREAQKTALESMKEQLRILDTKARMEWKAIWSAYDGLWPEVHQLPPRPRGG